MICLDIFSVKIKNTTDTRDVNLSSFLEKIFFVWIGVFVGLIFLVSVFLAIFQAISFTQLVYVYFGLNGITLLISSLLYFSRQYL